MLEQITVEEGRFGVNPKLTAKVPKLNVPIYEVGISNCGHAYDEGKNGGLNGVRAIYAILKYGLFR